MSTIAWPQKTRELRNHHFDSTVWNDFPFCDDDVVIATYAKSGTTWTQQIVGQLLFNGATDMDLHDLSPWLDLRVPPKEVKLAALKKQTNRRFIKTHLPVDALVFSPQAKYIYVGRDGRDILWSLYNYHVKANEAFYGALNDTPGWLARRSNAPAWMLCLTSGNGWKRMGIRSGRCGKMSAAGGRSEISPTSS